MSIERQYQDEIDELRAALAKIRQALNSWSTDFRQQIADALDEVGA